MTIADRIALIADGELVEHGTADDIYEAPRRRFTADFVGENNILDGAITAVAGDNVTVDLGCGEVTVPRRGATVDKGRNVSISLRSELLRVAGEGHEPADNQESLSATYRESVYLGLTTSHISLLPDGRELTARVISRGADDARGLSEGQAVKIVWDRSAARLHLD